MPLPVANPDANAVARAVFDGLPPRYDRLAWLLSFGQDRRWRAEVVRRVAAVRPGRVLDVATGPGGVALALVRALPTSVVGVDLNVPMLRAAAANVRAQAREAQVRLVAARGEQLPFADASFDALTFAYLLRYVDDPAATLAELGRCLRPGATMASLEFYVPPTLVWRLAWRLYVAAVLPVAGLVTGGRPWWRVGRFLGPSIRSHYARYPLDWHVRAWRDAGFVDVGCRVMSLGGGVVMWGTRAG
jgi:demethylmenaquinone methyltransferase/2-methoxy-6-polyprenyl-1,4-benzoquinol methylase